MPQAQVTVLPLLPMVHPSTPIMLLLPLPSTTHPLPSTTHPLQHTVLLPQHIVLPLRHTALLFLLTALLLQPTTLLLLLTAHLLRLMELLRSRSPLMVLPRKLRNQREVTALHHPHMEPQLHNTLHQHQSTTHPQPLPTMRRLQFLPVTVVKRSRLDCMNVWITLIGSTF